ncbi:hypothetical protein LCGC14_1829400, partial [marine sediment metagenome]
MKRNFLTRLTMVLLTVGLAGVFSAAGAAAGALE